ncbi:hypothetical protein D018_2637B, partial [Vibrio parahaemolyticus VP2007-007]
QAFSKINKTLFGLLY